MHSLGSGPTPRIVAVTACWAVTGRHGLGWARFCLFACKQCIAEIELNASPAKKSYPEDHYYHPWMILSSPSYVCLTTNPFNQSHNTKEHQTKRLSSLASHLQVQNGEFKNGEWSTSKYVKHTSTLNELLCGKGLAAAPVAPRMINLSVRLLEYQ